MEDTLRERCNYLKLIVHGLNPCFNGRYSQSYADGTPVWNGEKSS